MPVPNIHAVNFAKWTLVSGTWTKQTFTPTGANATAFAVTGGTTIHLVAVTVIAESSP
jgi:hypothetical protein